MLFDGLNQFMRFIAPILYPDFTGGGGGPINFKEVRQIWEKSFLSH